ncbi:hypothetical protein [Intrasporangium sp. DVR]|uniref:hypothetical protein n=1 Tax=Intrasporangium sp. DVR TaxID=3127867 RepID=UPI00313A6EFB
MRIHTSARRAVTSAVLGAVLVTGTGVASHAASGAAPATARVAASSVVTVVPVSGAGTTAAAMPVAVSGGAMTITAAGEAGALGLPSIIISFVEKALSFLGKSWTWLKGIVSQGYQAFLTYFWNKIPSWIKTVVSWAYTAYEIYQALRDFFF